jgi:hypothetical protein
MDSRIAELVSQARERAMQADFGPEAEALNRAILEQLRDDIGSKTRLAKCLLERGQRDEARALYEAVIALNPENHIAVNGLAAMRAFDAPPPAPKTPTDRRKASPGCDRPVWRARTMEVDITAADAARFATEMEQQLFQDEERGYKHALHLVIAAMLSPGNLESGMLPARLADVFGPHDPNLDALGLSDAEQRTVRDGARGLGLRGSFNNLTGGHHGYPQFSWIPGAVEAGLGPEIAETFRQLVDRTRPLAWRVDTFRSTLSDIAAEFKGGGGVVQAAELRISTAFAALILGAYDPQTYAFYMAGALKHGYEHYTRRIEFPSSGCSRGEAYAEVCGFVASIAEALRAHGVPVRDLIDAQSFIWLRFCWGDKVHTAADSAARSRRQARSGSTAAGRANPGPGVAA